MEQFKIIGYYLCEITDTPKWLSGIGRRMLSVSTCLGEQHPRQECFLGRWQKGESEKYRKKLKMDEEQYREFTEEAKRLFACGRMDVDCRLRHLTDARSFYRRICRAVPCRVVSVAVLPEHFEMIAEEWKESSCKATYEETEIGRWIGSDILGWDIGGFHSFLCNALQNDLPEARFNDMGLLENEFCEVAEFARQIEGKGEPVEWIPSRIGVYGQNAEFDRLTGGVCITGQP